MEPTVKQLQDTIAQLKEALVNWNYVVAQDGELVQLPITKKMVNSKRALSPSYSDEWLDHEILNDNDFLKHLERFK